MKKGLKQDLTYLKSHAATGEVFNGQLLKTQVETITIIDELKSEVRRLSRTIEKANIQSESTEKSNYRLQVVMLGLALVTTAVGIFEFTTKILETVGISGSVLAYSSTVVSAVVTTIVFWWISKEIPKW